MANTYIVPNFNIDTDVDVAGLIILKGGAPALTDHIYVYNGATLNIEQALSVLKIWVGETSGGAAPAGQRFGHIFMNAGQTVIFAGAAAATNSGILSNPAGADVSSRQSRLTILGTAGARIVLTNSVGALNAANRWGIVWIYGDPPQIDYTDFLYFYNAAFNSYGWNTLSCAAVASRTWTGLGFNGLGGTSAIIVAGPLVPGTSLTLLNPTVTGTWAGDHILLQSYTNAVPDSMAVVGAIYTHLGITDYFVPLRDRAAAAAVRYTNSCRFSALDIRPTLTVPAGLALANPLPPASGELTVSWTNAAAYAVGDRVVVYDNATGVILGIFDATVGTGQITGLAAGQAYTVNARATSDNYIFSDPSAPVGPVTAAPWPTTHLRVMGQMVDLQ